MILLIHIKRIPVYIVSLLIVCLSSLDVSSQYSIAPSALSITYPSKSSQMIVRMSPGAKTTEFKIESDFKLSSPHSSITVSNQTKELNNHDISTSIRFSPRRFLLSAGEEQIIRLTIPDADQLPDGEYWARMITSAIEVPEKSNDPASNMSIQLGVEVKTITGILFRKGIINTGLKILEYEIVHVDNELHIQTQLDRLGNAAWVGSVEFYLRDEANKEVYKNTVGTNVYTKGVYKYVLKIPEHLKGTYELEVRWISVREGSAIPIISTQTETIKVEIQII